MNWIVIGILYCVYLFWAWPSFSEPLFGDSFVLPLHAENLFSAHVYTAMHPPLYPLTLNGVLLLGGYSPVHYRLVGAACFLLTLILIYRIAKKLGGEGPAGIACFLYAVNPMAVRGSLITDIDTTVLVPLLLAFILLFMKYADEDTPRGTLLLGALFGVLLLAMLTTPLLLIVAMAVYYAVRGQYRRAFVRPAAIFSVGALIFLSGWYACATLFHASFLYPFRYILSSFVNLNVAGASAGSGLVSFARVLLRLSLYVALPLLLLYALAVVRRFRAVVNGRSADATDFIAVFSVLLFAGYVVVGNLTHGFPKYHYPFVAVCCLLVAPLLAEAGRELSRKQVLLALAGCAVLAVVQNVALGDLLYQTDFQLRENAITALRPMKELLLSLSLKGVLYLLVIPLSFVLARRALPGNGRLRTVVVALCVAGLSMNLSLDFLQRQAPYSTVYCYGGRGDAVFFTALRRTHEQGKGVLAPNDLVYYAGVRNRTERDGIWKDPRRFLATIEDERVGCVAYGMSTNTVSQYRDIFRNAEVQKLLQERFDREEHGSFTLYLRKKAQLSGQVSPVVSKKGASLSATTVSEQTEQAELKGRNQ